MEKKCLRKKKDNLWVLFNGKEYCVGLTKEAQEELGAVSFASLKKSWYSLETRRYASGVGSRKKLSVNFQAH